MLKGTSRFVLEVLPYVLTALIAAVVVPGFLYSRAYGNKPSVALGVPGRSENVLGIIRQGHAASSHMLSDSFAKAAGDKQAYR